MTQQEFAEKEAKLLNKIPKEFHSAISFYAYEKGHAYGHEEVLGVMAGLVDVLKEPIEKYGTEILNKHDY